MSLVVLDAAAAVEVFLGTPEGGRLAAEVPRGSTTHVPELYVEVAAVLTDRRGAAARAVLP